MIKKILSLSLVLSFLFSTFPVTAQTADKSRSELQVSMNGELLEEIIPVAKNGSVYLPLRKIAEILQGITEWEKSTQSITILRPESLIKMKLNSTSAVVNGKTLSLAAPPFVTNGVTYVPIRFTAEAFGIKVSWNSKSSTVDIISNSQYAFVQKGNQYYWLHSKSGKVYTTDPQNQILTLGTTDFRWEGTAYTHSEALKIDSNTVLFTVVQYGGTTLAIRNHYQMLIHHSKLVKAASVQYFDGLSDDNQKELNGQAIMRDQSNVAFIDPDGSTSSSYDLAKLTKLDNVFSVEAAYDDYLLVRAHPHGTLWIIDRKSNEATALYQKLLSPEQQQFIDRWEKTDNMYQGDGLKLSSRKENNWEFTFVEWWSDGKESIISFTTP